MENLEAYYKQFETHKATLVQDTDRYTIIDWRREDGGGNYYVNYIIDKKRGALIVSGDIGDSIAVWYTPLTVGKIRCFIRNDIEYYVKKIQCASDLYYYGDSDAVFEDIRFCLDEEVVKELVEKENSYIYSTVEEYWDYIKEEVEESCGYYRDFRPTENLTDELQKFDPEYYQWLESCGRYIHPRVYCWAKGLDMACEQLEKQGVDLNA